MYAKALEEALVDSKKDYDDIHRREQQQEIDRIVRSL